MGSFTGAVPCKSVTQGYKGWLTTDGNRRQSIKVQASLTARPKGRAGTKVGLSDPLTRNGCAQSLMDKSYPGDNRVVSPESSYRRRGSLPRCRLIISSRWRRWEGSVCSPVKMVRELGSERRKTVDCIRHFAVTSH